MVNKINKETTNSLPSGYLPLEQVLNFPVVSVYKKKSALKVQLTLISHINKHTTKILAIPRTITSNKAQERKHTLVLSRMTNIKVVFRGLNNRIITCKDITS